MFRKNFKQFGFRTPVWVQAKWMAFRSQAKFTLIKQKMKQTIQPFLRKKEANFTNKNK